MDESARSSSIFASKRTTEESSGRYPGWVRRHRGIRERMPRAERVVCPECDGTGRCQCCDGEGDVINEGDRSWK